MSESIDWPRMHPPRRRRLFFLLMLAVVAVVFGGRTALSYYVDVLWFESLGYRDVFWKTLGLQWGIFTAFAVATFLILYGSFLALKRAYLPDLPSGHTIFIGGQPLKLPVEPVLRLITLGLSLAIAAVTGASMMLEWPTLAVMTCALAVFFILITGGTRAFAGRSRTYVTLAWRGLSITFAVFLLVLAIRVYLG